MHGICENQVHIPINSRSRVPSGIGRFAVVHPDRNTVFLTGFHQGGIVIIKGDVSVGTHTHRFSIDEHFPVSVDAFKTDIYHLPLLLCRNVYRLPVPGHPVAGQARDAIYEVTSFEFLRTLGLRAQPTASNDFKVRREAAAAPMQRLIQGQPGLIVNRKCKLLRKALGGGYHFKRVSIGSGQERFRDAPNKNEHSHIGDSFGYLMLGGGEYNRMVRQPTLGGQAPKMVVANTDFDIFG